MLKKRLIHLLTIIISLSFVAVFLIPILWMFFVSLKPEGTPIENAFQWFKPAYTLENITYIIKDTAMMNWMFNSIFVAIIVTALILTLTSLAAFALSKLEFRFKNFIFFFFLAGIMIPGEAMIIPLFVIVKDMSLLDTLWGIILPALGGSMNIIILKGFFDGLPKDLFDCADIDGASKFTEYYKIVLPLAKPALATLGIFSFIGSWNSFLWPYLCIMSEELYTIPVGIPAFNSSYSRDYVLPMAANVVASLPIICTFLIFEKNIVKGITLTGLKG